MRTLAISGPRCKESLDESSASLLLMHALRQLRNIDAKSSGSSRNKPKSSSLHSAPLAALPHGSDTPAHERIVGRGLHTAAVVGVTLAAGSVIVKGRTASETYNNYRQIFRAFHQLRVSLSHEVQFHSVTAQTGVPQPSW